MDFSRPYGTGRGLWEWPPALKRRAILGRPYGTRVCAANADGFVQGEASRKA